MDMGNRLRELRNAPRLPFGDILYPHPTSDSQAIDIAASGLGLKSRLPID
jgi:hypothetical protein